MQAGLLDLESLIPKSFRKPRNPAGKRTEEFSATSGAQHYLSSGRDPPFKPTWQDWLFRRSKKNSQGLNPGDLPRQDPESDSGSIFPRRSLSAKAALDPRLRCTEVDGEGKVIMVDGEFKKSELIAKVRTEHAEKASRSLHILANCLS